MEPKASTSAADGHPEHDEGAEVVSRAGGQSAESLARAARRWIDRDVEEVKRELVTRELMIRMTHWSYTTLTDVAQRFVPY